MDKKTIKNIFVIMAAAFVLIPSLLTSFSGATLPESVDHISLSAALLLIIGYVLVDIKLDNKKQLVGKLAACAGLLYALVMQWIG